MEQVCRLSLRSKRVLTDHAWSFYFLVISFHRQLLDHSSQRGCRPSRQMLPAGMWSCAFSLSAEAFKPCHRPGCLRLKHQSRRDAPAQIKCDSGCTVTTYMKGTATPKQMKWITVSDVLRFCPLWIWKLISKKNVCDVRRQRRTRRATSSCSLRRFCVTPSCAPFQGSKCWNKPWMNKVLFFNMQRNKVWVNGSSCVSNGQSVFWMVVKWLVKTRGADSWRPCLRAMCAGRFCPAEGATAKGLHLSVIALSCSFQL